MDINNLINKTYYINLEMDLHKREYMERLLINQKLKYERFNAFNGKYEKEKCNEYLKKIKSTFCKNKKNKDGNIGCFLSHMKVLELIQEQKEGIYLVLEDDVKFHPRWKRAVKKLLNKIPNNWHILKLCNMGNKKYDGNNWYGEQINNLIKLKMPPKNRNQNSVASGYLINHKKNNIKNIFNIFIKNSNLDWVIYRDNISNISSDELNIYASRQNYIRLNTNLKSSRDKLNKI